MGNPGINFLTQALSLLSTVPLELVWSLKLTYLLLPFSKPSQKQFDSEDEFDDDMRFKEAVDEISAKNSKVSQPALKHVKSQMQKEYMITLLSDYYQTLSTEIYRALKKAKVSLL